MIIRELHDNDLLKAIQLKVQCWPEELAGMSDKKLDVEKEYLFWFEWSHQGIDNNDIRTLIGAFENDDLLGVAFCSLAETEDLDHGIELNGLWVAPHARGRGISFKLLSKIIDYYVNLGFKEIVIYNFHNSSSNSYYRKLGAMVLRTEYQLEECVPVDVFQCDIKTMKDNITKNRSNERTQQS